jgi:hypothetical protein
MYAIYVFVLETNHHLRQSDSKGLNEVNHAIRNLTQIPIQSCC